MKIQDAQMEMRQVYQGGAVGQMVSGVIWLASAGLGTFVSTSAGLISLFFGGLFIFPLTQLTLKLMGRPASASKENTLNALAKQVAFMVPLCLPVIVAAEQGNVNWYYPAFLVVVGAHYLPFITLYGIWQYAILAGLMIAAGAVMILWFPAPFAAGGWFGGVVLVIFAVYLWVRTNQLKASEGKTGN